MPAMTVFRGKYLQEGHLKETIKIFRPYVRGQLAPIPNERFLIS